MGRSEQIPSFLSSSQRLAHLLDENVMAVPRIIDLFLGGVFVILNTGCL